MDPQRGVGGAVPVVRVEPLGVTIEVSPGETLIEAAWREGFDWPTVCYGQAQCAVCHVRVLDGVENLAPPESEEGDAIRTLLGARAGRLGEIRLACRLEVTGGAVVEKRGVRRS
ncbi:2Fe-2S iron-sulfur cluster-binding protein [Pseudofrankia sp. BMG5.36]|uniref:2Fe-2S iron-sulfur cluster-binding protein n=1 Tax=Pseudofrankia sp. BMG5.36 TaxID=1834512 RepID=UPI0009F5E885|nr:2Fe-2S iron-sulfur cluster-binding protein [Pseudofrankia sp. BMG5.36]